MRFLKIVAATGLTFLSAGSGGGACASSAPDDITQVMTRLFASLKSGDRHAWDTLTTSHFHIFENGKDLSREQTFASVRSIFDKGGNIEWSVRNQQVDIVPPMATINYINDGAITTAGKRVRVVWLESAVLRQSPAGWQIEFMQSERAKDVDQTK